MPRLHFPEIGPPSGQPEPAILGLRPPQAPAGPMPDIHSHRSQVRPRPPSPDSPATPTAPTHFPVINDPAVIRAASESLPSRLVSMARMDPEQRSQLSALRDKAAAMQQQDYRAIGGLQGHDVAAERLGKASTAASLAGSLIPVPGAGIAGSLVSAGLQGGQAQQHHAGAASIERMLPYVADPHSRFHDEANLRKARAKQTVATAVATASQLPGASMVAKRATKGAVDDSEHARMSKIAAESHVPGRQRSHSAGSFDDISPPSPSSSPRGRR